MKALSSSSAVGRDSGLNSKHLRVKSCKNDGTFSRDVHGVLPSFNFL